MPLDKCSDSITFLIHLVLPECATIKRTKDKPSRAALHKPCLKKVIDTMPMTVKLLFLSLYFGRFRAPAFNLNASCLEP